MSVRRRELCVLAAVILAASGCEDGAELQALQERLRRAELQLAEKQAIAQNLNERRRDLEALEQKVADAALPKTWDGTQMMQRVNAAAPGTVQAFSPNANGAHVVLGSDSGPQGLALALDGVLQQLPAALFRDAELHGKTWRAQFDLDKLDLSSAAATAATPAAAPAPLPPKSWRSGEESERLRQRIARTEAMNAQLDKVLGEVANLDVRRRQATAALEKLNEPGRAHATLPLVRAVFTAEPPLVTDATARFVDGALRVQVNAGKTPEQIGEALQGKAKLVAFSAGKPATLELAPPTP